MLCITVSSGDLERAKTPQRADVRTTSLANDTKFDAATNKRTGGMREIRAMKYM